MTKNITIRPDIPPELQDNPECYSVSGHPNCVKLLSKLGIKNCLLLNWSNPHRKSPANTKQNRDSKPLAILIPSINGSSGVIVLKLVSGLKTEETSVGLAEQVFQQIIDLDLFVSSLHLNQSSLQVDLLFVVNNPNKCPVLEQRVCKMKQLVAEKSADLKIVRLQVHHVTRKSEKDNLEQAQGTIFRSILNKCISMGTPKETDRENSNPIIEAIIESTAETKYLEVSDTVYNCNNSEINAGFSLQNVPKVKEVYSQFFKDSLNKVVFLPDLDCRKQLLLDSTCNYKGTLGLQEADGFFGEYVNFTECILSKLKNPKGVLMRGYSKVHLEAVLDEPFSHNFEIDWILCGKERIFGFEVGRTDNAADPKKAIERKLEGVLCRIFPKFQYILVSFLKNFRMTSTEIKKYGEDHFGFVIYFPNIPKNTINSFFNENNSSVTKTKRLLSSMSQSVLSQIYVMANENEIFSSTVPNLYQFVCEEEIWGLKLAHLAIGDIFGCKNDSNLMDPLQLFYEPSGKEIAETRIIHEVHYLSGLLTFGFLVKTFSIHNDDPSRLTSSACSVETKRRTQSDLILSPQQRRILKENKRFLLLLGEPGCGKTSLLLARALDASEDPDIERIYFFIPETKSIFIRWIKKFIKESNSQALKDKIHIMESFRINEKSPVVLLSKSILLADELYLSSSDTYTEIDISMMQKSRIMDTLPFLKQCWLAKTEAGQDDKKNFTLATLPHFETEVLNVLFRSSWHIGSFSSKLLHKTKAISQSSAQTFGFNESTQYKVETATFEDVPDLIVKIRSSEKLISKFNDDRMAIVFTTRIRETLWKSWFTEIEDLVVQICTVEETMSYYDVPFTGIETSSVLLVIDYAKTRKAEFREFLSLILLAASRAQFELHIMIKTEYAEDLTMITQLCNHQGEDAIVVAARMGLPLELDKIFTKDLTSKQMIKRGNELLAIAILREDEKLLRTIIEKFPAKNVDLRQFFITLGRPKTVEVLDYVKTYLGPLLKNIFQIHTKLPTFLQNTFSTNHLTDLFNFGTRFCAIKCLNFMEELMGQNAFGTIIRQSELILFSACMNGDLYAIEWAVKTLEKYGALSKELNKVYGLWDGKKSTLLLFLSYMNMQDSEPIALLRKKGFDQNLLLFNELGGHNALETAMIHRNKRCVEELLKNPTWVRVFLPDRDSLKKLVARLGNDPTQAEICRHVILRFNFAWDRNV